SKEDKYFINDHLSFRIMFVRDHETDSAQIVRGERRGSTLSMAKALCELQLELHQQSSSFEVVEVGRKT
ncbi:hypothetical protein SLEP1_g36869, partial [Rubroshorea leprosula]